MDIHINKPKKLNKKYFLFFILLVIVGFSTFFVKAYFGNSTSWVELDKLRIAEVKRGDFEISVRANGALKPQNMYWISSSVNGRVEHIYNKAGSQVKSGDPIVKLNNPELIQLADQAQSKLEQVVAQNSASQAKMESALLDIEAQVLNAEMSYLSNKLELDAQTTLINNGNSTVSKIDYQRSKFSVSRSHKEWQIQLKRLEKHNNNMQAQVQAQQAHIAVLKSELKQSQLNLANLIVRAKVDGIVQKMTLSLGQSIRLGESIAEIADSHNLIAQVNVQELQIKDVSLGLSVIIDTHKSKISGIVSRIDPSVTNGMVQVDVKLISKLPSEARPELSVEGIINILHKPDTLYVRKPLFSPSETTAKVYRVSHDNTKASLISANYGRASVNYIEILSGLDQGDKIIVSDPQEFSEHKHILLKN